MPQAVLPDAWLAVGVDMLIQALAMHMACHWAAMCRRNCFSATESPVFVTRMVTLMRASKGAVTGGAIAPVRFERAAESGPLSGRLPLVRCPEPAH